MNIVKLNMKKKMHFESETSVAHARPTADGDRWRSLSLSRVGRAAGAARGAAFFGISIHDGGHIGRDARPRVGPFALMWRSQFAYWWCHRHSAGLWMRVPGEDIQSFSHQRAGVVRTFGEALALALGLVSDSRTFASVEVRRCGRSSLGPTPSTDDIEAEFVDIDLNGVDADDGSLDHVGGG